TGKVCGLVTDTPSSMQKLWRLVEAAMPKVLAMGCWAHILNLFFTDVKKLPRIFEHIEEAKDNVNLFARQVIPHEWKVPMEFVDEVMELEQVFRKRMDYGHHVALFLAALLDPRYRHKPHNLTIDEVWAAEELAAKLASADGLGMDASGNAARLELLGTWLEPDYVVGMGLKMDRFAPDLTADPVAWWRSIPATSAATERMFNAFKFISSDRRSRLLLGRIWIMSYVFFNTRVMTRKEHHASAEAQEE
ncbi:hypothetical protein QJQ45_017228, partial [Haematococcus lacustris]